MAKNTYEEKVFWNRLHLSIIFTLYHLAPLDVDVVRTTVTSSAESGFVLEWTKIRAIVPQKRNNQTETELQEMTLADAIKKFATPLGYLPRKLATKDTKQWENNVIFVIAFETVVEASLHISFSSALLLLPFCFLISTPFLFCPCCSNNGGPWSL